MTVHLYDGIAVIRRDLESDQLGRAPRKIFLDMMAVKPTDVAVWCWDGQGAKQWRQAIYPAYKAKRVPQPDSVWATIKMMRNVLRYTKALQVTAPEFEADDLIAHYAQQANAASHVKIHSVDKDLSALMVNPYVTASFGLIPGPKPAVEGEGQQCIQPRWVQLYKMCVGDPSDNIAGIPGFGKKTWWDISDLGWLEDLERIINHQLNETGALHGGTDRSRAVWNMIPKRCQRLLELDQVPLRAMKQIIGFRPLTETPPVIVGTNEFAAGDAILKEFFL